MNKQEVLAMIDHLPDQIDPEQLMAELYLKAKLDRAEAAVANGEVVRHEEVVERSRQWFT
jgi:predicted transcriptional regulator